MGQIASSVANMLDNSKEKEAQAKEQLELMMKLADARLDTFQAKLTTMFLDKDSTQKTSVPGNWALRFERHVAVDTETTVKMELRGLSLHVHMLTVLYSLVPAWKLPLMPSLEPLRRASMAFSRVSKM